MAQSTWSTPQVAAGVTAALVLLATLVHRRRPARGGLALLLIALAAAAGGRTWSSRAAAAPEASSLQAPARGRWRTEVEGRACLGSVVGDPRRSELPPGAVRDGELVELSPGASPERTARGPVPARAGPRPTSRVQLDEVRRLGDGRTLVALELGRHLQRLRASALARIDGLADGATRGLAAALLLGDRSRLPDGLADLFTRTGTRHALALSGLHVGLVAALWIWPAGRALAALAGLALRGRGRRLATDPAPWRALLLLAFVPLAGGGAPVVRAALALALAGLAPLAPLRPLSPHEPLSPLQPVARERRRPDGLSVWALAALLEWLAHPDALSQLSVQLSYLATLGLLLLTPGLASAWRPETSERLAVDRLGRRRPPWLRVPLVVALRSVRYGLAASLAATLATLPIVWWCFGEWSPVGPVATLLLLPPLTAFLGIGWLWLALPAAPLEGLLGLLALAMTSLLESLDGWPGTPLPLPPRPALLLTAAGATTLAAGALRGRPGRQLVWLAVLLWGVCCWPRAASPDGLEVIAHDVGHGTAVGIRAPGSPVWLFDAGSRDRRGVARAAVEPWLRAREILRPGVVCSHAERDHAGALPRVCERFPPRIWAGAVPARLAGRLPHDCLRVDTGPGRLELGTEGELGLTLVRGLAEEGNEGSRDLELRWRGSRVLLCGDAEDDGRASMLRQGLVQGPYDLVLFPHHGSETPWLGPFLEAARPRLVWFSAAARPPVADELDRRGIPWRSTHRDGPLSWSPTPGRVDSGTGPDQARCVQGSG